MKRRAVASIEENPKGSGSYRVRVRIDRRLQTIDSGLTRSEAEHVADAYHATKHREELRQGLTLAQFGGGFLDRRERAGIRAIAKDRARWRKHVEADPIGALAVSTLERRDVLDWLDRRTKLAHQTQKNALNLLRVALQEACDRGLIQHNPARDVRVHRAGRAKQTDDLEGILTPDEQTALLSVVPQRDRDAVAFALYSGVRQSSEWWLRRADCHEAEVFIRRHKNGRPRVLPLLAPAADAMARSLERRFGKSNRRSPWAFPAPMGGRRHAELTPSGWSTWVKDAGIQRRVRWHDLRHTCATSLLAGWWGRRWSLDEVCDYLGHSSVKVTERYARKLQETLRSAVSATKFPGGNGNGGKALKSLIDDGGLQNRHTPVRIRSSPQVKKDESVGDPAQGQELKRNFVALPALEALALAAGSVLRVRVPYRRRRKEARRA